MAEKDRVDTIYPSSEQDLLEAFNQSPDISKVIEDSDRNIFIIQTEPNPESNSENIVRNYIVVGLEWSKSENDKPYYPTLQCSIPGEYIKILFTKEGYLVLGKNSKNTSSEKILNKEERVQEILDLTKRGVQFINIFRNIPIALRADIRKKYIRRLDCKRNDTAEPTLDCVALTLDAINSVQTGEIKEITQKQSPLA